MSYTLSTATAAFLRSKRGRLAESSYGEYARVCEKMVADLGADLEVSELEPPAGIELVERWLDARWGDAPHAYNRNLSVVRGLVKFLLAREHLAKDPTAPIERSRPTRHARSTFPETELVRIIDACDNPTDRIATRLLLVYGLRKGALSGLQLMCFDRPRRMLSFKTKGNKYHAVPITSDAIWSDLEAIGGHPGDYLLHRRNDTTLPLSPHGVHKWWYGRLAQAGIVPPGTTSGHRMHKARHTAGQRLLEATGNLKEAQTLLGHASIQTTGDVYTDWDVGELASTMSNIDV